MRLLALFAIGGALAGVGYWQYKALGRVRTQIQVQTSFEKIRAEVRSLVLSGAAWEKTLAHGRNRGHLSGRPGPVALLDEAGAVVFDTHDPNAGLTVAGQRCNTLGVGGCTIKMNLSVEPVCTEADCANPARLVTARFLAAPNLTSQVDLSQLEFQTLRPPAALKPASIVPCRNPAEIWAGVDPSTGQMVCRSPPLRVNLLGTCGKERPECNCRKMGFQARFPAVCVGDAWACNCDLFWLKRMGFI